MNNAGQNKTIYIRLLEGGLVLVPVQAKQLDERKFQITDNNYLGLEYDYTSLWEFFPTDVVDCKLENDIIVAEKLLESHFPNRDFHALLFRIVYSEGKLSELEKAEFQEQIEVLLEGKSPVNQSRHPAIERWIAGNS